MTPAAVSSLVDDLAELGVLDHDRLDVQPGLELDLVHRRPVGRVGDGDEQAVAAREQRQRAAACQRLGVDELDRQVVRVEDVQVDQRETEGLGGELGDLRLAELLGRDQLLDEA